MTLFDGLFHPTTHEFAFVNASYFVALPHVLDCVGKKYGSVGTEEFSEDFQQAMMALRPLREDVSKFLVVGTEGDQWVGFFGNDVAMIPAANGIELELVKLLSIQGLRLSSIPNVYPQRDLVSGEMMGEDQEGNRTFCLDMPYEQEESERLISLTRRGERRWRISFEGEPLGFEDLEAYKKAALTDRFTQEMLASYTREMGVDAFNPGFYAGPFLLLTIKN